MQQFIPFEDEWAMLEALGAAALVPYQVGVPLEPALAGREFPHGPVGQGTPGWGSMTDGGRRTPAVRSMAEQYSSSSQ